WSSTTAPQKTRMFSVFAAATNAVFAVGDSGTVFRYNGTAWSLLTGVPTTTLRLYAVWAASPTDVYAGGAQGIAYRRNGTSWPPMGSTLTTTDTLTAISGSSALNILAVGNKGTVLRWNGTSWTKPTQSVTTQRFWAVQTLSTTEAYMIGEGAILVKFDGATFTNASTFNISECVALFSAGATNGTFAGCTIGLTFVTRSGITTALSLSGTYEGASMVNASSGFVAGDFSSILRLTSGTWTPVFRRDFGYYQAIWGESATSAYAVGNTGIDKFNGVTVTPQITGLGARVMNGVWGASGSAVFVVGDSGTIFKYDGTTWAGMVSPTTQELWAVGGSSITNVIAVGANGTILRNTGAAWNQMTSPVTNFLTGIWAADQNTAYV